MNKYIFLIAGLSLFFTNFGCQNTSTDKVNEIIENLKTRYAPDQRVALFDIVPQQKGGKVVLKGTTNLPEAHQALLSRLQEENMTVDNQIRLLPDGVLESHTHGIIRVSVANIRSKPGHSQELATQALLGTPVRLLDKQDNWYRIQTPDGYIAWLDHGGLTPVTRTDFEEWVSAPKLVYTSDFGFSYAKPDRDAARISDLTAGNILKTAGKEDGFVKVLYPDGRTGFVAAQEVELYDTWLASRIPSAENIITTAKSFVGRPYLWGGTSGKGVDCSGFTKMVFYLNGVQLSRDASQQVHTGNPVATDEDLLANLEAGDLLFFGRKADKEQKERITHVGIYMGDGLFIHSAGDAGVKIESLQPGGLNYNEDRLKSFVRAKRMLTSLGENGVYWLKDLPQYHSAAL